MGPDSQRQRHHYLCRLSRATNALGDLTTDAAGRADLGGSSIVTLEDQTYGDQVQLGTDTTLTGRHITFAQTVEGDGNGPWDLTVNGSGITTFAGSVGATNALGDLTTDAAGRADLGGSSIVTLEDQTYGDQVQLGTDTTLTGRHITFAQTAEGDGNGPWDLTVNGSGITTFAGSVCATNALGDLTTDAAGRADLGGSSIVTLEDQTYGDQVQLGADTTLTGRHITFAQTAEGDGNGPWDLTVNGSGITTFAGSVGATNALGDLTTDAADGLTRQFDRHARRPDLWGSGPAGHGHHPDRTPYHVCSNGGGGRQRAVGPDSQRQRHQYLCRLGRRHQCFGRSDDGCCGTG